MLLTRLPRTRPMVVASPRRVLPQRRMVKTKAFIDWELQSYLIGKGIGVFVLTYTTMNWWFYRRTREEMEKKEKEDEKNKKK